MIDSLQEHKNQRSKKLVYDFKIGTVPDLPHDFRKAAKSICSHLHYYAKLKYEDEILFLIFGNFGLKFLYQDYPNERKSLGLVYTCQNFGNTYMTYTKQWVINEENAFKEIVRLIHKCIVKYSDQNLVKF